MSIWVFSETSRLASGVQKLLDQLRQSVDTINNAITDLQNNIGDGNALSGLAYNRIGDTVDNYLKPITDGFSKLETNLSSSVSVYRVAGAMLAMSTKKVDSEKLEQSLQKEGQIQVTAEMLLDSTLAGVVPAFKDYVDSHGEKVNELRRLIGDYNTYKNSVHRLFDDDLAALNALNTALNDISNSTVNPDGSIAFKGNKVPSWNTDLKMYSASAGPSYK